MNVGIQTFTYGRYTAAAIARVWSGLARLPTQPKQWEWYRRTVEERGGLKSGYQWLNTAATARELPIGLMALDPRLTVQAPSAI